MVYGRPWIYGGSVYSRPWIYGWSMVDCGYIRAVCGRPWILHGWSVVDRGYMGVVGDRPWLYGWSGDMWAML